MKGIRLKESIEQFGFKQGFGFWFRWSFSDPIKEFVWTYLTKHPLCTEHGFFWKCPEDCKAVKFTKRRDKIKYQKDRRKQIDIEANTIACGKNGECAYCGKEKGTEEIDDPNGDSIKRWKVCKSCKEILCLQQDLNFYSMPLMYAKYPEKCLEINEKLSNIAKETGKPIINCSFTKNYFGGYSVELVAFDGKKDE